MKTVRNLSRRSFVASVTGGVVAGGALVVLGGEAFGQPAATGLTDQDSGSRSDNACFGRGGPGSRPCRPNTGVTDNDPGDPENGGRRVRTGCSDSDRGQGSDPGGWGRTCRPATGHTDNDPAPPRGDPVNGGRGRQRTGCTDRDSGQGSDRASYGRCR